MKNENVSKSLDEILKFYEEEQAKQQERELAKQTAFNKDDKWDFELEPKLINGELAEIFMYDLLTNDKLKFEVKSESKGRWGHTEEIYIEFQKQSYGKWVDSGINSTEAHYWVHMLKNFEDDETYVMPLIFNVEWLKDRIQTLLAVGKAKISQTENRKDGNNTKGYVVPLMNLLVYDGEMKARKFARAKELMNNKK